MADIALSLEPRDELREPQARLARRGRPPLEQLLELVGQLGRRRQHARAGLQLDEIDGAAPGTFDVATYRSPASSPFCGRTRSRDVVVEVGVGARDGVGAPEGDALELADAGHPHLVVVGDLDRDVLVRSDRVGLVELVRAHERTAPRACCRRCRRRSRRPRRSVSSAAMRMPAPGGSPDTSSITSSATSSRNAARNPASGLSCSCGSNGGCSSARTTLRCGPRHGDRGGGRPDEGDRDEHGCPEHAPRVGDGPLGASHAGDRTALRDRDPHEPADDRDEEDQARLQRDADVDHAECDARDEQQRGRQRRRGRVAAAQGDRHREGGADEPEQERRHQQRLVRADRHRDRDELLPRQRRAGHQLDHAGRRRQHAGTAPDRAPRRVRRPRGRPRPRRRRRPRRAIDAACRPRRWPSR